MMEFCSNWTCHKPIVDADGNPVPYPANHIDGIPYCGECAAVMRGETL